jgi:Uma2 family endonuclease
MSTASADLIIGQKPPPGLRLGYEEFLEAEFDHAHYEWVDGEIIEMNAIDDVQARVQTWVLRLLGNYVELKDLGEVFLDPFQMKAAEDLPGRQPDVQFIAKERLHLIQNKAMRGPADLVVEVVSYGSRKIDRQDKYAEYQQGGVREYWIVDPLQHEVDHYHLVDGHLANRHFVPGDVDEDGKMRSRVLPGIWLEKQWFFDRPPTLQVLKWWGVI